MFDKHYVGLDLTGVQDNGVQRPVSRVTLLLDDENAVTAGDDTGLELTSQSFTTQIQDANRSISSIRQYVDDITLSVSNGYDSSTITLKSVIAEDAQSLANDLDGTVGAWCYRGTTYIDGEMLMTGTVRASRLQGGIVELLDSREDVVGELSIAYTQDGYGLGISTRYGGVRISAAGNFWVDADDGSLGLTESGLISGADCVPLSSGRFSLGAPGLNWSDVYADNDTIVTSDLKKKRDVFYDLAAGDRHCACGPTTGPADLWSAYDRFFDALRPASYRLIDGTSGRRHLGLVAQDVETALADAGLTGADFAGFVKSPRPDGGYGYALRYGEFIALCIHKIQQLTARVAGLEGRSAL